MSEKCGHSLQRRIVIVHVGGACVPQEELIGRLEAKENKTA
jgi:hypothetical protein